MTLVKTNIVYSHTATTVLATTEDTQSLWPWFHTLANTKAPCDVALHSGRL